MSAGAGVGRIEEAAGFMIRFAARTGLEGAGPPRRYLWTDAFALCNALALHRATGDARFDRMGSTLVEQVHGVLGRHRPDDARRGWISGLSEEQGRLHPTAGGLRIGKPLPERRQGEPFDEQVEWERDGQYFHYLTRWIHALDQLARVRSAPSFHVQARELYAAAYRGFVAVGPGPRLRMIWKASIDLTRATVASMGQHDPLDGWITGLVLRTTAERLPGCEAAPDLQPALADFARLTDLRSLDTLDPLGLGGLLQDTSRIAQLQLAGVPELDGCLDALVDGACRSLAELGRTRALDRPAARRLGFRELGLAIGLAALGPVERVLAARVERSGSADARTGAADAERDRRRLAALAAARALAGTILAFWRSEANRIASGWDDHADINEVMLATALWPDGWVTLASIRSDEEEESCSGMNR